MLLLRSGCHDEQSPLRGRELFVIEPSVSRLPRRAGERCVRRGDIVVCVRHLFNFRACGFMVVVVVEEPALRACLAELRVLVMVFVDGADLVKRALLRGRSKAPVSPGGLESRVRRDAAGIVGVHGVGAILQGARVLRVENPPRAMLVVLAHGRAPPHGAVLVDVAKHGVCVRKNHVLLETRDRVVVACALARAGLSCALVPDGIVQVMVELGLVHDGDKVVHHCSRVVYRPLNNAAGHLLGVALSNRALLLVARLGDAVFRASDAAVFRGNNRTGLGGVSTLAALAARREIGPLRNHAVHRATVGVATLLVDPRVTGPLDVTIDVVGLNHVGAAHAATPLRVHRRSGALVGAIELAVVAGLGATVEGLRGPCPTLAIEGVLDTSAPPGLVLGPVKAEGVCNSVEAGARLAGGAVVLSRGEFAGFTVDAQSRAVLLLELARRARLAVGHGRFGGGVQATLAGGARGALHVRGGVGVLATRAFLAGDLAGRVVGEMAQATIGTQTRAGAGLELARRARGAGRDVIRTGVVIGTAHGAADAAVGFFVALELARSALVARAPAALRLVATGQALNARVGAGITLVLADFAQTAGRRHDHAGGRNRLERAGFASLILVLVVVVPFAGVGVAVSALFSGVVRARLATELSNRGQNARSGLGSVVASGGAGGPFVPLIVRAVNRARRHVALTGRHKVGWALRAAVVGLCLDRPEPLLCTAAASLSAVRGTTPGTHLAVDRAGRRAARLGLSKVGANSAIVLRSEDHAASEDGAHTARPGAGRFRPLRQRAVHGDTARIGGAGHAERRKPCDEQQLAHWRKYPPTAFFGGGKVCLSKRVQKGAKPFVRYYGWCPVWGRYYAGRLGFVLIVRKSPQRMNAHL